MVGSACTYDHALRWFRPACVQAEKEARAEDAAELAMPMPAHNHASPTIVERGANDVERSPPAVRLSLQQRGRAVIAAVAN